MPKASKGEENREETSTRLLNEGLMENCKLQSGVKSLKKHI